MVLTKTTTTTLTNEPIQIRKLKMVDVKTFGKIVNVTATTKNLSKRHRALQQPYSNHMNKIKKKHPKHKGKLIFHLGPGKMGTTFLQCTLASSAATKVLSQDRIVFWGHTSPDCRWHNNAVEFNSNNRNKTPIRQEFGRVEDILITKPRKVLVRKSFRHALARLRQDGHYRHVLIVSEHLQFSKRQINTLARVLKFDDWEVDVVINYRRLYEYLPSLYAQRHKPTPYVRNSWARVWPNQTISNKRSQNKTITNKTTETKMMVGRAILPFDLDNRGEWSNHVRKLEQNADYHPTLLTVDQVAPASHVHSWTVINLHDLPAVPLLPVSVSDRSANSSRYRQEEGSILVQLFCTVLKSVAPLTCQALLQGSFGQFETVINPSYRLDYDILATAAYDAGVIRGSKSRSNHENVSTITTTTIETFPSRPHVVKAIQLRLEKDQARGDESSDSPPIPVVCLSNATLQRILTASMRAESKLFPQSFSAEQHAIDFDRYRHSKRKPFCSINTVKVLRNPSWRSFLASL